MSVQPPQGDDEHARTVQCPHCGDKGIPRSVTTDGPQRVLVELRCASCRHEWTQTRLTPRS